VDKTTRNSFLKYIGKSTFAQVGVSLYILGDTYFISVYAGADGLAALNLIIPVLCLIYAIGAMISMGFAQRFKIDKAEGNNVDNAFMGSVIVSLLASLPFFILGIVCPREISLLLGSGDLADLGTPYLRVILLAAPLFIIGYTFLSFTRNDDNPTIAMLGSFIGCIFNLIFDYIFMFILDLGLMGAALATACCPLIASLMCLTHFRRPNCTIKIKLKCEEKILSWKLVKSSFSLGVPALMSELTTAITTLVFNYLILDISGSTGVAAFGVIINISCVFIAFFNGLAEGAQPMISESYGSGNLDKMKSLFKVAAIITFIFEAVVLLVTMMFPDGIVSIFNSKGDIEMQALSRIGMLEYFPAYIFVGINTLLLTYFTATDRPKPAAIGALLRGMILITLFAFILSKLFGMDGVWLSFITTELVTFIVLVILLRKNRIDNGTN